LRQDPDAAIHWLEIAAESYVSTGLKLGAIYLAGEIVPQNFELAVKWLTRAADSGHSRNAAMKMVAEKCFDGRLSAADEFSARAWLTQAGIAATMAATDPDDSFAIGNAQDLAELYELGLGVGKDMRKAIYWYKEAAKRGSHPARDRLRALGLDWKNADAPRRT
jgi:uncharacterized protein